MKTMMFAATAAAIAVASGAALAADLPRSQSPFAPQPAQINIYKWSGGYVGMSAGYQWGTTTNAGTQPSGIEGGIQAGYNWQSGAFVFGGETDLQVSNADDTFAPYKFSNPWFGTIRGRAGYALNNILFYGTGGFAYGGITGETGGLSESKTHVGWTAGAGVEFGVTQNWSAKVEYLYIDLGSRAYSITSTNNGLESNVLRFGVNYHF